MNKILSTLRFHLHSLTNGRDERSAAEERVTEGPIGFDGHVLLR